MQEPDGKLVAQLATGITMAVMMTGVLHGADEATMSHASAIMRGELNSLMQGKGEYGDALQGVENGTVSEGDALALVVASCVERIAAFREAG